MREIAQSMALKVGVNFVALLAIAWLLSAWVDGRIIGTIGAVLALFVAVIEGARFILAAWKRKSAALGVLAYAETPEYLADQLEQDILDNVRAPHRNLSDNDYIVSLLVTGGTIFIFHALPADLFGAGDWGRGAVAFVTAMAISLPIGLAIDAVANSLHRKVLARIEADPRELMRALSESWKIDDDRLKFDVKDADFATLFRLKDLTVERLTAILLVVDIDKKDKIIRVLQRMKDERAALTLCNFLRHKPVIDSLAVQALQKMGERAVPALRETLGDERSAVRLAAMNALAGIKQQSAIAALVGMLEDDDLEVRRAAIWDLNENNGAWVKTEAAGDAIGILTAELHEREPANRAFAAWALGMVKEAGAAKALLGALKDESAEVREAAAFALGEIEAVEAADALAAACDDTNTSVRTSALAALMKIDPARTRSITGSVSPA